MPKKNCPACGSTNTVGILYGLPTQEALDAEKCGKLVLGGCYISNDSLASNEVIYTSLSDAFYAKAFYAYYTKLIDLTSGPWACEIVPGGFGLPGLY